MGGFFFYIYIYVYVSYIPIQVDKMSPQLVSNRKIRPEGERLACSEYQPFQKKKGEGARSGNLLFMFFIT